MPPRNENRSGPIWRRPGLASGKKTHVPLKHTVLRKPGLHSRPHSTISFVERWRVGYEAFPGIAYFKFGLRCSELLDSRRQSPIQYTFELRRGTSGIHFATQDLSVADVTAVKLLIRVTVRT